MIRKVMHSPLTTSSHPFTIKQLDADRGLFVGYAAVFDHIDADQDVFLPGAFTKFLNSSSKRRVKLLWQHDRNFPIGSFSVIKEDNYGLLVTGRLLLDLAKGREAYSLLKNGIVDALSIGFTISKDKLDHQKRVRLIQEAELWEISLVTFPANSKARICDVKTTSPWQQLINEIKTATAQLR